MNSNSDFFFLIESFKSFFEKVLHAIGDPKGIATQEWLRYKDVLNAKESTPSSVYSYSNTLTIQPISSGNSNNITKLKKQASRQIDNVATPRRMIARRNSIGTGSDDQAGKQAPDNLNQPTTSNNNFSGGFAAAVSNQGISDQSPWTAAAGTDGATFEKKRNYDSPTQRMNFNEIKELKGLSEMGQATSKVSKQAEMYAASQKSLLGQIRFCIEKYKKESTGLDLIHDRSFSTQTILIENKRKPFDRNAKRQDSKFIRELSVYTKKGPATGGAQPQPGSGTAIPAPPSAFSNQKDLLTPEQRNFLMNQQNQFISQQNTQPAEQQPSTSTQNYLNQYAGTTTAPTDYVKVKQIQHSGDAQVAPISTTTTSNPYSTPSQFSKFQTGMTQQQSPSVTPAIIANNIGGSVPSYVPNTSLHGLADTYGIHKSPSSQAMPQLQSPQVSSGTPQPSSTDIESLVQKILSDQKSKDTTNILQQTPNSTSSMSSTQERMVLDIINKHKLNSPIQNFSPGGVASTTLNQGSLQNSPYAYNPTTAGNTYSPYNPTTSLGQAQLTPSQQQYPYTTPPNSNNKM